MSRRDLSQPSFVDALVSGYGKRGFSGSDRADVRLVGVERPLLAHDPCSRLEGAPGWQPLVMFKIPSFAAMACAVRPGGGGEQFGTGCRSAGLLLDLVGRDGRTPEHASIWLVSPGTIGKLGSFWAATKNNRQRNALGLVVKAARSSMRIRERSPAARISPYEGGGVNPREPGRAFLAQGATENLFRLQGASVRWTRRGGLVRQGGMTSANVHDSRLGEVLIQGDEQGAIFRRQGL